MALLFKTEDGEAKRARLSAEYDTMVDPILKAVLFDLSLWVGLQYGKDVIVTCLLRTPKENVEVGGVSNSAHLTGRAADIRSSIYSSDEIIQIQRYLKHRLGVTLYVLYHNAGNGLHIHLNINWGYSRQSFNAVA